MERGISKAWYTWRPRFSLFLALSSHDLHDSLIRFWHACLNRGSKCQRRLCKSGNRFVLSVGALLADLCEFHVSVGFHVVELMQLIQKFHIHVISSTSVWRDSYFSVRNSIFFQTIFSSRLVFDEYGRKPISLIPTVKKEGLTGKKGKNTMVAIEVAKKSERKKNGN